MLKLVAVLADEVKPSEVLTGCSSNQFGDGKFLTNSAIAVPSSESSFLINLFGGEVGVSIVGWEINLR